MSDALFALMIVCPVVFTGILACYFIDGVLKYRFKSRKAAYILTTLASLGLSVYVMISQNTIKTHVVGISSDDPMIIVAYLIMYVMLVILLDGKWWQRIQVPFLAFDILTIINTIFGQFRDLISEALNAVSDSAKMPLYIVFNLFVLAVEFSFLKVLDKIRSKNDNGPLPIPVILAIWFFLGISTGMFEIVVYDEETMTSVDYARKATSVFAMMAGLVFVVILFYIRATRRERNDLREMNASNEELIEMQTKYFEASAEADNKIRAMKHDMRNNLQVLTLLLENGEYDKMREYLEEMGGNLANADVSAHTGNTIADAIIADKVAKASEAGAKLNVSGTISGVEFTPVETCKILGNILDNAIEAVSDERLDGIDPDLKKIDLVFKRTDKFFMISLVNPCAECPEIRDGMIETDKSDKKNHGFGLKNVREAAEAYGGELSLACEDIKHICRFRTEIVFQLAG